jgi:hypothetical protein
MRVLLLCVVLVLTAPACTGGGGPPDSGATDSGLTEAGLLVGVPLCTVDPYRPDPFDFWTLQVADGGWTRDAGTSGCDERSSTTGPCPVVAPGCQEIDNDAACAGVATVSQAGAPRLTFDDGSSLTWTSNPSRSFLPPLLAEGQKVSVGVRRVYQLRDHGPDYSSNYQRGISVQTLQGGWLWSSAISYFQDPLQSAELAAVLGVGGRAGKPICQRLISFCQPTFRRVLVEQLIDTSPPTALRSGPPTVVSALNTTGRWQLYVLRAEDTQIAPYTGCADVGGLESENGFVFSRIGP